MVLTAGVLVLGLLSEESQDEQNAMSYKTQLSKTPMSLCSNMGR